MIAEVKAVGLTRLTGFSLNKGSTAVFGRRDVTTPAPIGLGVAPFIKWDTRRPNFKRVSPNTIPNQPFRTEGYFAMIGAWQNHFSRSPRTIRSMRYI